MKKFRDTGPMTVQFGTIRWIGKGSDIGIQIVPTLDGWEPMFDHILDTDCECRPYWQYNADAKTKWLLIHDVVV